MKGCNTSVYWDGSTYYSICLEHLEELNMGPFRPANLNGIGGKGEDTASLIFNNILDTERTFT
jgi:hypothetical protein